jgi:hypothetical protein
MTENLLLSLSIKQLYDLADSAMNLYIVASVNPNRKDLSDMRQVDLTLINKIIVDRRLNELN